MTFDPKSQSLPCIVCTSPANIIDQGNGAGIVDCSRCGNYFMNHNVVRDCGLPLADAKQIALASHIIRKAQGPKVFGLTKEFFDELPRRTLPTPAEAMDNMILWFVRQSDQRPGRSIAARASDLAIIASVGVVDAEDLHWVIESLLSEKLLTARPNHGIYLGSLSAMGWQRAEELKRAHIAARFAFFARKFDNADLDRMFKECLFDAVGQTGFELRIAPQKAGLVDAIIEDEIRRCRFLIADLSDGNAGAYWEAGFAEGLGKDVIYVCSAKDKNGAPNVTHFDTNHRHTVWWDLAEPAETARKLKAVIRNTLLGDAKQED